MSPATAVAWLVSRLLRCRPLMFMMSHDLYLLRDGQGGASAAGFDAIGGANEQPPLLLRHLQSYDEMVRPFPPTHALTLTLYHIHNMRTRFQALSSFLCVSTPTAFVNNGSRGNQAVSAAPGTFQPRGVYLAQVRACDVIPYPTVQ